MMLARSLLLLAALFPAVAPAQVPEAKACHAENESCREGCTLEFGTSFRTRGKLATCLEGCRSKHEVCSERWTVLDDRTPPVEPKPPTPAPEVQEPALEPVEGIILPTEEQLRGKPPTKPEPEPAEDISEWNPDGD
ncbi:MAG: hypothetical protein WBV82_03675 [Myxococcaceae bacterium]